MSAFQNGMSYRLGKNAAFWNLGPNVGFWNLERIVAFWKLGWIVAFLEFGTNCRTTLSCVDNSMYWLPMRHADRMNLPYLMIKLNIFLKQSWDVLIDMHSREKWIKLTSKQSWITNKIKTLITKRDAMFEKWILSPTEENHIAYETIRNKVTQMIRKRKKARRTWSKS